MDPEDVENKTRPGFGEEETDLEFDTAEELIASNEESSSEEETQAESEGVIGDKSILPEHLTLAAPQTTKGPPRVEVRELILSRLRRTDPPEDREEEPLEAQLERPGISLTGSPCISDDISRDFSSTPPYETNFMHLWNMFAEGGKGRQGKIPASRYAEFLKEYQETCWDSSGPLFDRTFILQGQASALDPNYAELEVSFESARKSMKQYGAEALFKRAIEALDFDKDGQIRVKYLPQLLDSLLDTMDNGVVSIENLNVVDDYSKRPDLKNLSISPDQVKDLLKTLTGQSIIEQLASSVKYDDEPYIRDEEEGKKRGEGEEPWKKNPRTPERSPTGALSRSPPYRTDMRGRPLAPARLRYSSDEHDPLSLTPPPQRRTQRSSLTSPEHDIFLNTPPLAQSTPLKRRGAVPGSQNDFAQDQSDNNPFLSSPARNLSSLISAGHSLQSPQDDSFAFTEDISILLDERDDLRGQVDSLRQELSIDQANMSAEKKIKAEVEQKLGLELAEANCEIRVLKRKVKKLQEALEERESDSRIAIDESENKYLNVQASNLKLREETRDTFEEVLQLRSAQDALQKRIEALEWAASEKDKKILSLEADLEVFEKVLEDEQAKSDKIDEQRKLIQELQTKNDELNEEHSKYELSYLGAGRREKKARRNRTDSRATLDLLENTENGSSEAEEEEAGGDDESESTTLSRKIDENKLAMKLFKALKDGRLEATLGTYESEEAEKQLNELLDKIELKYGRDQQTVSLKATKQQLFELHNKNTQLEGEVMRLNIELATQGAGRNELETLQQGGARDVQKLFSSTNAQIEQVKKERDEALAKLQMVTDVQAKAHQQEDKLPAQLDSEQKVIDQAKKHVGMQRTNLVQAKEQEAVMMEELTGSAAARELKEQLGSLLLQKESLSAKCAEQELTIKGLERQLVELESQGGTPRSQLQKEKKDFQKAKREELVNQEQMQEKQAEQNIKALENLALLEELAAEQKNATQKIAELEKDLKEGGVKLRGMNESYMKAKKDAEEEKGNAQKAAIKVKELEAELDREKKRANKTEADLISVKDTMEKLKNLTNTEKEATQLAPNEWRQAYEEGAQRALKEKEDMETRLRQKEAELTAQLRELENNLHAENEEIKRLKSELIDTQRKSAAESDELEKRIERARVGNAQFQERLARYRATVTQLQGTIIQREGTITQLRERIARHQVTITQLQNTITQLQDTILRREETIAQQRGTIVEQERTVFQQQSTITNLEKERPLPGKIDLAIVPNELIVRALRDLTPEELERLDPRLWPATPYENLTVLQFCVWPFLELIRWAIYVTPSLNNWYESTRAERDARRFQRRQQRQPRQQRQQREANISNVTGGAANIGQTNISNITGRAIRSSAVRMRGGEASSSFPSRHNFSKLTSSPNSGNISSQISHHNLRLRGGADTGAEHSTLSQVSSSSIEEIFNTVDPVKRCNSPSAWLRAFGWSSMFLLIFLTLIRQWVAVWKTEAIKLQWAEANGVMVTEWLRTRRPAVLCCEDDIYCEEPYLVRIFRMWLVEKLGIDRRPFVGG